MVVVDASVIIALAKIGRLELLQSVHDAAMILPAVYAEVVEAGRVMGAPEVQKIEAALGAGWLYLEALSPEEEGLAGQVAQRSPLGRGEAESIALASSRGLSLVVDDRQARAAAHAMNVRHFGTAALLLQGYSRGILDYEGLAEALRDLADVIWLSPAVVAEVLRLAREVDQ